MNAAAHSTLRRRVSWLLRMLGTGQFRALIVDIRFRCYRGFYSAVFRSRLLCGEGEGQPSEPDAGAIQVITEHPIAYTSPDHVVPWGTMNDNSTNRRFVLEMEWRVEAVFPNQRHGFLDLGCSGGQLVRDFRDLGWIAAGLEGSDYSLKHRRANWPDLGGVNLFTCDITKPFQVRCGVGQGPHPFHLITAWEVVEHIAPADLLQLFQNILAHLAPRGLFVASTNSFPDVHDGVDLHQTKMTNDAWHDWIAEHCPQFERVDLGLQYYEYVRFSDQERSFLTFRKR